MFNLWRDILNTYELKLIMSFKTHKFSLKLIVLKLAKHMIEIVLDDAQAITYFWSEYSEQYWLCVQDTPQQ